MLSLTDIVKDYTVGGTVSHALRGISLEFRKCEFVSILGPSGCGKTTLLNIIGGLDQYTSGDLTINGVSTKKYTDADWDSYRNHSIGFVFQSYNLIPHQTVLANVELALTLSGISKSERRRRAVEALKQVGLINQLHKKPNQMSGGQMQRVAIARALVNDPDILLADEPTGALDTQTSVQIMEILKEISSKKLIIMVTHNPDLAAKYSSRIIKVLDGKVVDDSKPYHPVKKIVYVKRKSDVEEEKKPLLSLGVSAEEIEKNHLGGAVETRYAKKKTIKKKKKSMSFFTALSLSLNNLLTKKGRTFMTSFAGSIGIIGIALILSVSTGVNNYIDSVQRDTLASYPIQLKAESVDLSSLVTTLMGKNQENEENKHALDKVYESAVIAKLMNSLNSAESTTNDLNAFKQYLETSGKFEEFLSAVQYSYDFNWVVLTKDTDGKVFQSDVNDLFSAMGYGNTSAAGSNSLMSSSMYSNYDVWEEMLAGLNGEPVNQLLTEQYDLIYGAWPQAYNEIVLVVDEQNEISDLALYALGLRTKSEILAGMASAMSGNMLDMTELSSWTYEELCRMNFRLLLSSECYQKQADGTYKDQTESSTGMDYLYNNPALGVDLKITGIIRPNGEATSNSLTGSIAYTSALTEFAIQKTATSALIQAQKDAPTVDILTGLPFATEETANMTPAEKKAAVTEYLSKLNNVQKAALYLTVASVPSDEAVNTYVSGAIAAMTPEQINGLLLTVFQQQLGTDAATASQYVDGLDAEKKTEYLALILSEQYKTTYRQNAETAFAAMTTDQILAQMNGMLSAMDDEGYAVLYDEYLPKQYSDATLEENLQKLGDVSLSSPAGINLYADTFEDKDSIAALITEYNSTVEESKQISYTDYVALLMSSVTTIVNAISYVLIAFVAISLVVSSIMIGIITYISVLERTKEIGILRAIGASKKDVSRVFNAETLIVGFVAGFIGIMLTLALNILINVILYHYTEIAALKAVLPVGGAIALVCISMFLTFIAGLFPAGFAAKRNPVEALRSE